MIEECKDNKGAMGIPTKTKTQVTLSCLLLGPVSPTRRLRCFYPKGHPLLNYTTSCFCKLLEAMSATYVRAHAS